MPLSVIDGSIALPHQRRRLHVADRVIPPDRRATRFGQRRNEKIRNIGRSGSLYQLKIVNHGTPSQLAKP